MVKTEGVVYVLAVGCHLSLNMHARMMHRLQVRGLHLVLNNFFQKSRTCIGMTIDVATGQ